MFKGCISLQEAPSLPAITLAKACYMCMFQDCTILSSVTMLAPHSEITAKENCVGGWLTNAGTAKSVTSRKLKLKDAAAYNVLKTTYYDDLVNEDAKIVLPDNWKISATGTTVLDENGKAIEENIIKQ